MCDGRWLCSSDNIIPRIYYREKYVIDKKTKKNKHVGNDYDRSHISDENVNIRSLSLATRSPPSVYSCTVVVMACTLQCMDCQFVRLIRVVCECIRFHIPAAREAFGRADQLSTFANVIFKQFWKVTVVLSYWQP